MGKGDWEVENRPNDEKIENRSACQLFGHCYEVVTEDDGTPVVLGTGVLMKCNDCGDTYEGDEVTMATGTPHEDPEHPGEIIYTDTQDQPAEPFPTSEDND